MFQEVLTAFAAQAVQLQGSPQQPWGLGPCLNLAPENKTVVFRIGFLCFFPTTEEAEELDLATAESGECLCGVHGPGVIDSTTEAMH